MHYAVANHIFFLVANHLNKQLQVLCLSQSTALANPVVAYLRDNHPGKWRPLCNAIITIKLGLACFLRLCGRETLVIDDQVSILGFASSSQLSIKLICISFLPHLHTVFGNVLRA